MLILFSSQPLRVIWSQIGIIKVNWKYVFEVGMNADQHGISSFGTFSDICWVGWTFWGGLINTLLTKLIPEWKFPPFKTKVVTRPNICTSSCLWPGSTKLKRECEPQTATCHWHPLCCRLSTEVCRKKTGYIHETQDKTWIWMWVVIDQKREENLHGWISDECTTENMNNQ